MADSWAGQHLRPLAVVTAAASVAAVTLVLVGSPSGALGPWALALAAAGFLVLGCRREHAGARDAAVAGLVRAIAEKDPYTGEHIERVARYSVAIGEELGLSRRRLARLRQAALLHDVGKLAVPTELLNKPGRLTDCEFDQVQRHASVCDDILTLVDVLRPFRGAASGHHRRYDGDGYGSRRAGLPAHIVAVADAYDAMTSTRAYRRALTQETAFEELRGQAGTQFDPRCVAGLIRAIERRGERHGLGYERSCVVFAVEPPVVGLGSAGLGYGAVTGHRAVPSHRAVPAGR